MYTKAEQAARGGSSGRGRVGASGVTPALLEGGDRWTWPVAPHADGSRFVSRARAGRRPGETGSRGHGGVTPTTYLAGGTGLGLRLGHRRSRDLDWFTSNRFSASGLEKQLASLPEKPSTLQRDGRHTVRACYGTLETSFITYDQAPARPHVVRLPGTEVPLADMEIMAVMKAAAVHGVTGFCQRFRPSLWVIASLVARVRRSPSRTSPSRMEIRSFSTSAHRAGEGNVV
jgi:hypothetical protein